MKIPKNITKKLIRRFLAKFFQLKLFIDYAQYRNKK